MEVGWQGILQMPVDGIKLLAILSGRQWGAMGGSPGNDIMFQWKEITAASRFQQKLWSIFRFSLPLIADVEANPGQVDRWLLGELDR